jgi:hypothetical protein
VRGYEQRGVELVERWELEELQVRAAALATADAALADAERLVAERRAERYEKRQALDAVETGWLERRAPFSVSAAETLREQVAERARKVAWAVREGGTPFVLAQVPPELHPEVLAKGREPPVAPGRRERVVRHGAYSAPRVVSLAAVQRRRLLRQLRLRADDLDAVGRGLLLNWSRTAAALSLLDHHVSAVGLLDEKGEPRGFAALYLRLLGHERQAHKALAGHVRARGDRGDALAAVLAEYEGG